MRIAILSAATILGVALLAGPASAQLLGIERFVPPPKAEFSADVTMTGGDQRVQGRVMRTREKERREFEIEGEHEIVIVRLDRKLVWSLVPEEKIFIETPLDEALGSGRGQTARHAATVTVTKLGTEAVEGVQAVKETVSGTDTDGSPIDGTLWISPKGIVLKVERNLVDEEGVRHLLRIELHNVRIGPQDPKLFEIPAGYRPAGQTRTGAGDRAPSGGARVG